MNSHSSIAPLRDSRREFCRHLVFGLVASAVGSKWFVADVLAQSASAGEFLLNLSDFPSLASVNGSAVITLPSAPTGLANVVITRNSATQFFAVDSTCAHNQCEVPPSTYNATAQQSEITCSCHGSRYQANGELLGGPAQRGLRAFVATLAAPGQLRIDLPEFRFAVAAAAAQPVSGQNRIRLSFPALSFLTYNVRFRASLGASWTVVPFARFATGSLNQTDLPGIGRDEEVFVAAPQPAGFFSVVTA